MKINIPILISAVQNAPAFEAPKISEGTTYLLNNTYNRLLRGEEVLLSDLDLNAFESEDISTLHDLYNNVYGKNNYQANHIVATLRMIAPTSKTAAYV